jgi:hypothetical protein
MNNPFIRADRLLLIPPEHREMVHYTLFEGSNRSLSLSLSPPVERIVSQNEGFLGASRAVESCYSPLDPSKELAGLP